MLENPYRPTEKTPLDEEEWVSAISARLKESTAIHGWLTFFLFAIIAGAVISTIYGLATLSPAEYGYSSGVLFSEVLTYLIYIALAIYTVSLFVRRRPNAVFYARVYMVLVLLSNLLALTSGGSTSRALRGGVVWPVIWLFYLSFSGQVQEIIPKSFRKVHKRDWGIVVVLVCLPLLITVVSACQQEI